MTRSRTEIRSAKPETEVLMSARDLSTWFAGAAAGERCLYFRGNLACARADKFHPDHHKTIELADAARRLGTPSGHAAGPRRSESSATEFGTGQGHLAQRRIAEDDYEYFIVKSAKAVLT